MSVELRLLEASDLPFARSMLFASIVPPLPGDPQKILALPDIRKYLDDWGRPGDRGFVASIGNEDVGAGWYRCFAASDPGYGFVDESTPEISTLAVAKEHRRQGVGRTLLDALTNAARADGFAALSLSVHRGNAEALALYRSAGFAAGDDIPSSNDQSVTMLLPL